jgi:hypothetical protein
MNRTTAAPARPDTESKIIDRERLDGNHFDHVDERLHVIEFAANVFAKHIALQVGRISSSFTLALDQTAGDEHQQCDAEHDPVKGKGRESAGAHPAHKPRDDA